MSTATVSSLTGRFADLVERGEFDRLAELYTGDALFDAHVPNWRFQVQGRTAITGQLRRWFQLPGRFHQWQTQPAGRGDLLVRFEWREREGTAQSIVSREMHLWRLAGGRIAEQVVFCAGRWDPPLVARLAVEAPLVRALTAPAPEPGDTGDPGDMGRTVGTGGMGGTGDADTRVAVARFEDAFGRRDIDAVMAAMTDDCLFEDTTPPEGVRHHGPAAVRRCWERLFAASPEAVFDTEETVVAGDRAVVRWRYRWTQDGGGQVRGVDLFTIRDGRIAEKRSYVKG